MKKVVEAVYKDGNLTLLGEPKIESETIKVRIVNRDEILTRDDIDDILSALKEKSEGKLKRLEEVFK